MIGLAWCSDCHKDVRPCACGAFTSVRFHDHTTRRWWCEECLNKSNPPADDPGGFQVRRWDRLRDNLFLVEDIPDEEFLAAMRNPLVPRV